MKLRNLIHETFNTEGIDLLVRGPNGKLVVMNHVTLTYGNGTHMPPTSAILSNSAAEELISKEVKDAGTD